MIVFWQSVFFRAKLLYLGKVVVFGQNCCIGTKVVVFGQSGFIRENMVLLVHGSCILASWL